MQLKFNEELHKYYLENEDGSPLLEAFNKPFVSVSKFLETFVDPFNETEQAEKFVTSKNNKLGLSSTQEVLDYWELRRTLGTKVHAEDENLDIEAGAYSYKRDSNGHKICYTRQELMNLPLGVHREVTCFLMSAWLIGTSDKITVYLNEKGERTIDMLDIKTNGHKLVTEPKKFYQKDKGYSDYKYFYAPLNHRPCDTFQKYIYQLSTYCYFFEKMGYKIGNIVIDAMDMDDKGNISNRRLMPVEYRRDDVKLMVDYYLKTRK